MDLFRQLITDPPNLLPQDGTVKYHGILLSPDEADDYLIRLTQNIQWQRDQAKIYGKHITTKRKVAWYGERPFAYTYSNTTKWALPWTAELLELKHKTEQHTGARFNACLLNLYHDGDEGMTWHSDDERELEPHAPIASLSLGAERKFAFKHKQNGHTESLILEHGSLLTMEENTQKHWLHRLPPSKKVTQARVNLTFRRMKAQPHHGN